MRPFHLSNNLPLTDVSLSPVLTNSSEQPGAHPRKCLCETSFQTYVPEGDCWVAGYMAKHRHVTLETVSAQLLYSGVSEAQHYRRLGPDPLLWGLSWALKEVWQCPWPPPTRCRQQALPTLGGVDTNDYQVSRVGAKSPPVENLRPTPFLALSNSLYFSLQ